jgi:hypothetical protein
MGFLKDRMRNSFTKEHKFEAAKYGRIKSRGSNSNHTSMLPCMVKRCYPLDSIQERYLKPFLAHSSWLLSELLLYGRYFHKNHLILVGM